MARRSTDRPVPPWAGDLPVFERTLANGFKTLVLPRRHAPAVVCDLYYPVGSSDEPAGRTGLAHFVEHMLFKGTERFPKGRIDQLAFVASGQTNAETDEDTTHYWFAFPSDRWELALTIEADRMRGANFHPDEVESERRVIIEERAREQESPFVRLDQTHLALSYLRHPYRNPVLGWPDDLARITVDDLRGFYRDHYRPDGAVLVVVGDVDPDRCLDACERQFAGIAPGPARPAAQPIDEPRQNGRRDFRQVESEAVARGILGWHTVPIGHPDGPALDVLSDLLTCGRRSRLWDTLVERDMVATWVDAGQEGARLAGQFLLQVEVVPGVDVDRVDRTITEVIATLADEGPTPAELDRSRSRLEAAWRWEQEDLAGLAAGLGQFALTGDWRSWQADHRAAMAVTAEDIRRVASTYLGESNLTVGWSLPRPAQSVTVLLPTEARAPVERPAPSPGADAADLDLQFTPMPTRLADFQPRRDVLRNGVRLITEHRPDTGVIALELYADAGLLREAKPGLAHLTGRLLEEGTTTRSAEELAEAIEDVGGALEVGATGASLRVRAEDLPMALDWLADLAIRPAFPADAVAWNRRKMAAELQSDRDDPAFRADLLFRGLIHGDHPYARDPRGTAREIARLTREDVVAHHAGYFVPENAILVAVGDFDPKALQRLVKARFGGWKADRAPFPILPPQSLGKRPRVRRVDHDGEQVHVLMGHLGVHRLDPDFDALTVVDHILGSGPGFTDRLSRVIRDEMGLAYSVGGGMTDSADRGPGQFRVYLGTNPDDVERAVAAVQDQVRLIHRGAFGDDEVERARTYLAGSWVFDFQTVEQRAERLLELERFGLPLDDPIRWPDRIARVTPDEARDAAARHLHPEALTRVEYGPIRRPGRAADVECA
ncbi:M16 family metallopeptidase [Tundrisphaera sp. TA3]|uniref:M16 family metallopeptidase n=1 Tax=Tundrisphaera sp. TA3 TaxID=3435775 RepID=UPI003EBD9B6E